MITQAIIASQPIPIREVPVPATAQLVIQAANEARDAAQASADAAATSAASIRIDAETFASIPPLVNSCFVFVETDETNADAPTLYFFDGTSLNWVPMVGV